MSTKAIKTVLLVEDNLGDARLLREMLNEQKPRNTELTHVEFMREAEKYLAEHAVDIILLDLGLPDAEGLGAVRRARIAAPDVTLVVLTGLDDELLAAQALQEGAQDYLIKGQIETRALLRALRYGLERKRLAQLQDEFISTVSHELRTPLTSISGSLGLLVAKAGGDLPVTAARLIAIAYKNSQRLVRLVNDILDIEKMESGQVPFNLGQIEVRSLVEQAIDANREFAQGCGVGLRLEESSLHQVSADPDRLMQVVTNLLSNAIKFSPPGADVVVAIENVGQCVRISVRDQGSGIPANFKHRIFEKFAQADTSNQRQKGGTGLGLSIVKQIVLRLGGEVGFRDAPGGGTIFYVDLPRLDAVDPADTTHAEKVEKTRIQRHQDGGDVVTASDLSRVISGALMRATEKAHSPILVGLLLPDGDDIGLVQQLRERPQYADTPIVVVSAASEQRRDDLKSSTFNVLNWLNESLDVRRQLQTIRSSIARNRGTRLRILHLDDDPDVLGIVAQALNSDAQLVSVATIAEARRVLTGSDFDLAVIDLALDSSSGLDLLPELHDSAGDAIPAIVYSAQGAIPVRVADEQAAPPRSLTSIDSLIAILRNRVAVPFSYASEERESA
jgi:signal transduction histidine kinase